MARLWKRRATYVVLDEKRRAKPDICFVVSDHPAFLGNKHKLERCSREEATIVLNQMGAPSARNDAKAMILGDLDAVTLEDHPTAEELAQGFTEPQGGAYDPNVAQGFASGQSDSPVGEETDDDTNEDPTEPQGEPEDLVPHEKGLINEEGMSPQQRAGLTKRRRNVARRLEKEHGERFTGKPEVVRQVIVDSNIRRAKEAEEKAAVELAAKKAEEAKAAG